MPARSFSPAINSTTFEDTDLETEEHVLVGSKTKTVLLKFANELGWADYRKTHEVADIVQMLPFSGSRKAMGIVVKLDDCRYHELPTPCVSIKF